MLDGDHYIGDELEIFREAICWKKYFSRMLRPFIRGRVLEVGAGIGGTTSILCNETVEEWICLEPDPELATTLQQLIVAQPQLGKCKVRTNFVRDLEKNQKFDAILYVDVLEHIEDDRAELQQAMKHLATDGSLIVLSPAHQWLYSEFDKAIGHYRRYTKTSLLQLTPPGASVRIARYLDSVGMVASAANRLMLSQSMPKRRQILFWDRCMVPISRLLDPLLTYSVGKSVIAIWTDGKGQRSSTST